MRMIAYKTHTRSHTRKHTLQYSYLVKMHKSTDLSITPQDCHKALSHTDHTCTKYTHWLAGYVFGTWSNRPSVWASLKQDFTLSVSVWLTQQAYRQFSSACLSKLQSSLHFTEHTHTYTQTSVRLGYPHASPSPKCEAAKELYLQKKCLKYQLPILQVRTNRGIYFITVHSCLSKILMFAISLSFPSSSI